jgi:outer membrane protein assembly factor BamA
VPMSLDFGFPIRKAPEDDRQILSFSVGWVF